MIVPLVPIALEEIVGSLVAVTAGAAGAHLGIEKLIQRWFSLKERKLPPSSTADLIKRLHSASSDMDSVIVELQAAADERLQRVSALETSINELAEKEKNLRERIQGTEGISKATVDALAQIIGQKLETVEGPKRRRDYALFVAGVVVSAIVGVGIEASKPIWEKALHLHIETSGTNGHQGTPGPVLPRSDPENTTTGK